MAKEAAGRWPFVTACWDAQPLDRRYSHQRTNGPAFHDLEPIDGGEGGIRTHVGLPRTAFPVPRPRPLGDLSARGTAWRRGWDSNPRYGYPHTAFRERHLQPLGHLSAPVGSV